MKKTPKIPISVRLRRAESELASMRERYFDLYDLAPAGIFTLSETGVIQEANLTLATLLGIERSLLAKRPLVDFVHPQERGRFEEHCRLFLKKQATPHIELRMQRARPPEFWARLEMTLGHDADGGVLCRVVMNDVTERVRAQADLLRLRAAVDHAHDGIAIADMEGRLQFSNLAWAEMHGYSPAELIGKPLSISHTEKQMEEEVLPFNKKVLTLGSWASEIGHVRRNGETFACWMSTVVLRDADGQAVGLIGMADDITERRRAEEALARILVEREAILKSIPDLFYRLDAEMNLQDWNAVFERVSGYAAEELKGMNALAFFKTDKKLIAEGIEEAIKKGQAYRKGRLLTRQGTEVPIFWSAAALRAADGSLQGIVGIGRDLTVK